METSGFPAWGLGALTYPTHPATFSSLCLSCMCPNARHGHVKCFLRQHAGKHATNQTSQCFWASYTYLDICLMPFPSPEWESKQPVHLTFDSCLLSCVFPPSTRSNLAAFHSLWSYSGFLCHVLLIPGKNCPNLLPWCCNVKISAGKHDLLGREGKTQIGSIF